MLRCLPIALILCLGTGVLCGDEKDAGPSSKKQQALRWLDRFAAEQVLFHAEDVQKLHDKVAGMSDAEAADWWDKTADYRELFERPEWLKTRKWLKEFLKVQAIYSEKEIAYFQSEAFAKARESEKSLREIMDDLISQRAAMIAQGQQSEATRKQLLEMRNAYDELRQREAAALRRSPPPAPQVPVVVRDRPERYNQPLITSLDAARWTIMRNFFPRW